MENNRRRFHQVVPKELATIFKGFSDEKELSDKEVIEAYYKFSSQIQTNTLSAAELEFVIVATIAANKPNLSEELLAKPFLMLVWTFGDKINSKTVTQFIDGYILHEKAQPYGGLPGEKAVRWLKEYFAQNDEAVQRKLDEVIAQNNYELSEI